MGTGGTPGNPGGRAPDDADDDVRRWLAERLGDPEVAERDPSTDETPTSPGLRQSPLRAGGRTVTLTDGEDEDDPATEVDGSLEGALRRLGSDDDGDPRTVRVTRLPLRFIGESVIDDETVRAEGWSLPEGPVDEVPLTAPRTPTPAPRRAPPGRRPVRAPEVVVAPSVSTVSRGARAALNAPAPEPWWPVAAAVGVGLVVGLFGAAAVLWVAL